MRLEKTATTARRIVAALPALTLTVAAPASAGVGFELEFDGRYITTWAYDNSQDDCPSSAENCRLERLSRQTALVIDEDTGTAIESDDSFISYAIDWITHSPSKRNYHRYVDANTSLELVVPRTRPGLPLHSRGRSVLNEAMANAVSLIKTLYAASIAEKDRDATYYTAESLLGVMRVNNGVATSGTAVKVLARSRIAAAPSDQDIFDNAFNPTMQATVGVPLRCIPDFVTDEEHGFSSFSSRRTSHMAALKKAVRSTRTRLAGIWGDARPLTRDDENATIGLVALAAAQARALTMRPEQVDGAQKAPSFAFKANLALMPRNDFSSMAGLLGQGARDFLREPVAVDIRGRGPVTMTRWSMLVLEVLSQLNESSRVTMTGATTRTVTISSVLLDTKLGAGQVPAAPTVLEWLEGVIDEAGSDPIHQRNADYRIQRTLQFPDVGANITLDVVIDPFESMAALGSRFDTYRRDPGVEQAPVFEIRTLGRVPVKEIQETARRVFDTMQANFVDNIETCGAQR